MISVAEYDRYLTQKEVCRRLQVSVKTLQALRRKQKIKFYRFGFRTIRFKLVDVVRFEEQAKQ